MMNPPVWIQGCTLGTRPDDCVTVRPHPAALCVRPDLWCLFTPQLHTAQSQQALPSSPVSLRLFVGELSLTVSNVAIQL